MVFVDVLAFEIVTLLIAAVLLAYTAVVGYLAIRRNDPDGLASALRGSSVPTGSVGLASLILGLWGQMAWPRSREATTSS